MFVCLNMFVCMYVCLFVCLFVFLGGVGLFVFVWTDLFHFEYNKLPPASCSKHPVAANARDFEGLFSALNKLSLFWFRCLKKINHDK